MDVLRLLFAAIFGLLRVSFIVLFWLTKWLYRRGCALLRPRSTTHGSARWATLADLTRGNALGGDTGIIVGKKFGQFIRFKREGAVMVCAPMGQGKGVGVVIPNLLDHRGAAIVTDPKGENYAITHRHRSTLGPVFRLDAIHPDQSNVFNPLTMIRMGTYHEADDAAQIADFLVIPEYREKHWDTAAKNLLTAVIRYVLHNYPDYQRNLSTVSELVTASPPQFLQLLERMTVCNLPSVAQEARLLLASIENTEAARNVVQNAGKAMAFWGKDRIGGLLTRTSEFSLLDLNREAMTVYVMVPDDQIEVFGPLLRMMTGCALSALMRGKDLPRPPHRPMLMLDECRALGRLEALAKGMGLLREYCHTLLIWQDLGQLRELYGSTGEQSFTAAASCQVTFGVADTRTAQQLATDVGRTTVWSRSEGLSEGNFDLLRAQHQDGRSETGRDLKDPAEMRRLGPDECVIVMLGQVAAPILAGKVRYYTEGCWRGLYDPWRRNAQVLEFPDRDPPSPAGGRQREAA